MRAFSIVCWQGAVAANWSDPLKREAAYVERYVSFILAGLIIFFSRFRLHRCKPVGARKRSNVGVTFLAADGIVRVNVFFRLRKQVYQFEINCLNAGSILD